MHSPSAFAMFRGLLTWTTAALLALLINILLFGLMPGLTDQKPRLPDHPPAVANINVIRVKRPEPPAPTPKPRREVKPDPEPPKKMRTQQTPRRPAPKRKFHLPFEINTRLPAFSGDFQAPPMETVALDAPALKSTYGVGEIDQPLTALVRTPPIYPMRARRRGIEGSVKVRFVVTEEGRVTDIQILESRPKKIFDRAVIRCVSGWRFSPGTVEGLPVKTWVETTIVFELQR